MRVLVALLVVVGCKCTAPLTDAFAEIEGDQARLKELDTPDTREKDLDARFKTICGRGLFTK